MLGLTRNKLFFGEKGDQAVRSEVEEGGAAEADKNQTSPETTATRSRAPSRHSLAASSSQL